MLARALASSPTWENMEGATIVVRSSPAVLGFLGTFGPRAVARIESLVDQIRTELPRLRYVPYPQVESDCEELAALLEARFGREEIRSMDFVAIPRGGLIVLGILSYFLDLRPSRLVQMSLRRRQPLVVVDDCSVSGIRFGQFLTTLPQRPVVFAPLYSHPELRSAIEGEEPRVLAVMSPRDLSDNAPLLGPEYPEWRERWAGRSGDEAFWIGRPERLGFPWSETDLNFWNPVAEHEEAGWRLVPPELCLKNRVAAAGPHAPRIQRQPPGKGPCGPSSTTLFAYIDDRVIVANYATGESVQLADVAARMWRGIVEYGNPPDVVESLRDVYDVKEVELLHDLTTFLEEMEQKGFLQRAVSASAG